jgi:hypothetical protein
MKETRHFPTTVATTTEKEPWTTDAADVRKALRIGREELLKSEGFVLDYF